MKIYRTNFLKHPSKKVLIVFTALWIIGISLLTLSMTDLFTEPFFQKKYFMLYFIIIGSTIVIGKLYVNKFKI